MLHMVYRKNKENFFSDSFTLRGIFDVNCHYFCKVKILVFLNNTVTIYGSEQFPCIPNAITTKESIYLSPLVYETEEISSKCSCICSSTTNISIDEHQIKLNEIREELAVTKSSLSSSQRKKICAPDERKSSTRIGIVGLCVIIGILLVLIVNDIFSGVLHFFKLQKKKNR